MQADISYKNLLQLVSQIKFRKTKLPHLSCGTFSGREKDMFAFNTFLNQLHNVKGTRKYLSDATKLACLIGYLRDCALSVVKHLSITDVNYKVPINILEREF